jgi:hypothetical protein
MCTGIDESSAVIVNWNVPLAVGVPVRAPVLLSVKPAGSVPVVVEKVYGGTVPPLAVIVWL